MKKTSQLALLIAGLSLVILVVLRLIMGGFENFMWLLIGLGLLGLSYVLVSEFRLLLDFLTLKTTKHGMNMVTLILIAVVGLVAVNFIAVQREKKFDWTSDGLNSLAEQSVKAVENLKEEMSIVLLYRKGAGQEQALRREAKGLSDLYEQKSSKIRFVEHDVIMRPDLAQKYQFTAGDAGLFVEQGARHLRVEGFKEQDLTKAIIKLGRSDKKIIYLATGHDERALEANPASSDPALADPKETLAALKPDLETLYTIRELNLALDPKVPEDAAILAIVGPKKPYLEPALEAVREFGRRGGAILIAADPGVPHNMALLTKSFGIEFKNNYVLDPRARIPGMGNIGALGTTFAAENLITRDLKGNAMALFLLASGLQAAPDAKGIKVENIVQTNEQPMSTNTLNMENIQYRSNGPHTLMAEATGKLPGAEKEFTAVVVGDSDFMSSQLAAFGMNRDLALNTISALAKDTDVISIRPKDPKASKFEATNTQLRILYYGFLIPVPILMFILSGIVWHRRRTA